MSNRQFTGVIVSVLLVLPAGCGARSEPVAAEKPFDAKAALAASTAGIQVGDYSFRIVRPKDDEVSGAVHRPSQSIGLQMTMRLDQETSAAVNVRVIGPLRYQKLQMDAASLKKLKQQRKMIARLGRPRDPKVKEALAKLDLGLETFGGERWAKLDKTRLEDSSTIEYDVSTDRPDVTGAGALVGWAATAAGDRTTINGTLDATRITGTEEVINAETFKEIPAGTAKAVPFVATLDTEGRLTKLVMELPAAEELPAGTWTVELTGYGAAPAQQAPPAGEIKEATPDIYEMMNGS
jgi:hypothetical protein